MTNDTRKLERQIEALVRTHLEACRSAAVAAVERAVAHSNEPARRRPRAKPAGNQSKRRSQAELAALSERFLAAVCATPGETMLVLAPKVGAKAVDLQVPVARLKRDKRVRSAGNKHCTRYFPAATELSLEAVRGRAQ